MSKFRADVVHWNDIATPPSDGYSPNLDHTYKDYKILAEGDSWFSLNAPFYRGKFPTNILFNLRFQKSTLIVHCAKPGDTLKNMAKIASNTALKAALSKNGLDWNLILISGGGNDLLERASTLLKPANKRNVNASDPEDFCNLEAIDKFLAGIQDNHRAIAKIRDTHGGCAVGKPIITHTYDYATPRDAPARLFSIPLLGPWIIKEFRRENIPEQQWIPLADYLIDRLAYALLALTDPKNGINNFHVVDTRETLKRAKPRTKNDNEDWINEFHPNSAGYKKLVVKWHAVFDCLLK